MSLLEGGLRELSRQCGSELETLHVVSYFAPDVTAKYEDIGLDPGLAYFPVRAAAMGAVGPEIATATFYVFAPRLVRMALPAAWDRVDPGRLVEARRAGTAATLRRILHGSEVSEALGIARRVVAGFDLAGRPLYAAHAGLSWPEDDLLALWHAATLIREHRGDGHFAVLQAEGLSPVEATVLGAKYTSSFEFLRSTRGWNEVEWAAAENSLRHRGWLESGELTPAGKAARDQIEERTDVLALDGWRGVGVADAARLLQLLTPLGEAIRASGLVPRRLGNLASHRAWQERWQRPVEAEPC